MKTKKEIKERVAEINGRMRYVKELIQEDKTLDGLVIKAYNRTSARLLKEKAVLEWVLN